MHLHALRCKFSKFIIVCIIISKYLLLDIFPGDNFSLLIKKTKKFIDRPSQDVHLVRPRMYARDNSHIYHTWLTTFAARVTFPTVLSTHPSRGRVDLTKRNYAFIRARARLQIYENVIFY